MSPKIPTREHLHCEQLLNQTLSDREIALFHAGSLHRAVTGSHGGSMVDAQIDRLAWQELDGNGFWSDGDRDFIRRKLQEQINTAHRLVDSIRRHSLLGSN